MNAKRRHFRCPACDKVSLFRPEEPTVCRRCGHAPEERWTAAPTGDDAAQATRAQQAFASAPEAAGQTGPTIILQQQQQQGGGSGTALGIVSIVAAAFALMTVWVFPVAFLLAVVAVATGAGALSQDGDAGAVVGTVGIVLGVFVLILAFLILLSTPEASGSGGSGGEEGGSGGGSGGGHGGGSGGSSGGGSGGGSGGSSGGGGGGSGGGGGAGGSSPGHAWTGTLATLLVVGWSRR